MAWVYLVFAGLFEMLGVAMINQWNKTKKLKALIFFDRSVWY